jgi:hypothetical protein
MKQKILVLCGILLMAAMIHQAAAQTKCVWIEKSIDGKQAQKIGVSLAVVKLLAELDGDFDMNGVKIQYKSLLQAYRSGSVTRIKDDKENSETEVYGGKFDQKMNEYSEKHDRLIIENAKNEEEQEVSKIHKIREKSKEAVVMLLAMIGSSDFDDSSDKIESALEQGGVLYVRDYEKDSRLWIYVN